MKKRLLIIGSDSSIAQQFLETFGQTFKLTLIAQRNYQREDAVIYKDFFDIDKKYFSKQDFVINFAAVVHRPKEKWDLYSEINVNLPLFLAKKAKENGIKHFIQLSSTSVFGEPLHINDKTAEQPLDYYGKSKLMADNELMAFADNGFYVHIVRPPLIYGIKDAPGNMNQIVKLGSSMRPLPFRNANGKKDVLNIENLMIFFECLLKCDLNSSEIYYPKDKQAVSLKDILQIVRNQLNLPDRLFNMPPVLKAAIRKFFPGLYIKLYKSKTIFSQPLLERIGYEPLFSLKDGINKMI